MRPAVDHSARCIPQIPSCLNSQIAVLSTVILLGTNMTKAFALACLIGLLLLNFMIPKSLADSIVDENHCSLPANFKAKGFKCNSVGDFGFNYTERGDKIYAPGAVVRESPGVGQWPILPATFLGRWQVSARRTKIVGFSANLQADAESLYPPSTNVEWNIAQSGVNKWTLTFDKATVPLRIVQVENGTVSCRCEQDQTQYGIVLTLVPSEDQLNGSESIFVFKDGAMNGQVSYELVAQRSKSSTLVK